VDGFERGRAGRPDIFNEENALAGTQSKTAPQGEHAAGVAFHEKSGTATGTARRSRQGSSHFLTDNEAAESRGNYRFSVNVWNEGRRGGSEPLRVARVLQDQGALDIGVAVEAAGKLKVTAANGLRGLKESQILVRGVHFLPCGATAELGAGALGA